MTEIYRRYEEQFINDFEAVRTKLNEPTQTPQHFKEIRAILSECQKNIKLMQTQLSSDPRPQKARAAANLKNYRQEYNAAKKQLFAKESNFQYEINKKQLLSTRPNSCESVKVQDKSLEVNERLQESVKVMYENLEISESVQGQLQRQTSQIISSKGKVVSIRNDLALSQRKIKSMMMRIRKNKLVLRGVLGAIALVFLIILISYFR